MNSHGDSHRTASVIYVLIANLTDMVAEMLHQTIQQQPDIKLLNSVKEWEEINAAVAETDVLVLGVDDVYSPPEACFRLLSTHPNLKILVVAVSSDEAIAYWRALHCHPIQMTSSQTLIASIRQICLLSPF